MGVSMKELFAAAAIGFSIAGHVPYIISTWRGKIHPHPYSWIIWTIVTLVIAAGQWAKGGGVGALPTVVTGVFGCTIFLLSLRHGFKHVHRIDHLFLAAALLAIVPWIYTKDPTLSVVAMTCIDTIGFLPTIRKAWVKPHTEHSIVFAMNVPRHVFELAALESYNIATALDPTVMLFVNSATVLVIELRRHFAVHKLPRHHRAA